MTILPIHDSIDLVENNEGISFFFSFFLAGRILLTTLGFYFVYFQSNFVNVKKIVKLCVQNKRKYLEENFSSALTYPCVCLKRSCVS